MSAALVLENVSKRYRLGTAQGSLRDFIASVGQRLGRLSPYEEPSEYIWALRSISLELPRGGVLGVIGSNGAGKTTLLKLLSRITKPTTGWIDAEGRMSSLIELGAGFHPDLTGRENVYLNGSILGLTRKQIDARFDSIVEFAELSRFIDTPVKRYSSGMYARLGFAVAAHADPALLVVDEVLAVGDGPFQRKCYDFIRRFVASDRTAVFVSHNMTVIEQICSQVLWIDRGQQRMLDAPDRVLPAYYDAMDQQRLSSNQHSTTASSHLHIASVRVTDGSGIEREAYQTGDDVIVHLEYNSSGPPERPHFCVAIATADGGPALVLASMLVDGQAPEQVVGSGVMSCRFRSVPLLPKVYEIWGEVWGSDRIEELVKWQRLGAFRISAPDDLQTSSLARGGIRHFRADAPIQVAHDWMHVPGDAV